MSAYERLLRPVLFRAYRGDAERIHERTLAMITLVGRNSFLRNAVAGILARHQQSVTVAGIRFPALVGLAAGMDKNGVGVAAWSALGFGHVELGSVTAHAQPGNDRPRIFRLPESKAVINRMGFNNAGAHALADRLEKAGVRRGNRAVGIPLGISIGKSKITPLAEATADYLTSFTVLAPYADYIAINVSSPNTPGLRTLQDSERLRGLTSTLISRARELEPANPVPIFVKLAPDLTEPALEQLLEVCTDKGVQGLIATNTTLSRDGVAYADLARSTEAGGLSGAPVAARARAVVAFLRARTTLPIIGVGGILTRDDGQAMLDAGADLLQVYTGYIYRGPALVTALNELTTQNDQALEETR
jgi:dihydroorotate dehydrogenase